MGGLVTHFLSLNLNPLRDLCPFNKSVLARLEQGDVDGPGEVVITWLGNSIQESRGVQTALDWDMAWELWVSWYCHCVFRDLSSWNRTTLESPSVLRFPCLWARAEMCCSRLGSDFVESWCLLYLALTEIYTLLLLFSQKWSLFWCVLTPVRTDNSKPSCQRLGRSWLLWIPLPAGLLQPLLLARLYLTSEVLLQHFRYFIQNFSVNEENQCWIALFVLEWDQKIPQRKGAPEDPVLILMII